MLSKSYVRYQQDTDAHKLENCCTALLSCVTSQGTDQLSIHFRDGLGGLFWSGELHKAHTTADAGAGVPQDLA